MSTFFSLISPFFFYFGNHSSFLLLLFVEGRLKWCVAEITDVFSFSNQCEFIFCFFSSDFGLKHKIHVQFPWAFRQMDTLHCELCISRLVKYLSFLCLKIHCIHLGYYLWNFCRANNLWCFNKKPKTVVTFSLHLNWSLAPENPFT